jgi:peroxidase
MSLLNYIAATGVCAAVCAAPALSQNRHVIGLLDEFRPIGGGGNNLINPDFDPVPGKPELLVAPLNFKPGTKNGLVDGPNPRTISNLIAGGSSTNGDDAQTTDPVASAWLYVFGQFVDHDISLESNAPDGPAIDIPVPPGDPVFDGPSIQMTRDLRSPQTNTIINTVAGFLDLSQLYGSTAEIAASLRNADGTLKTSNDGKALQIVDERFITGDPRVNENPELAAVTILFMREHNFWVGELKNQNPGWDGDQLYHMAKEIITAEYQNIIYREYLPVLVGPAVGSYRGYDPSVNAQVTQEFSTVAFRVGHSQISETQSGIDNRGNLVYTQSLAQAFFNTAEETLRNGVDGLMRNVTAEFSQATDVYTVPVLRNLLFAPLPGGNVDQVDLIAIDIQRERDVGVASLAQMRKALGLPAYRSFADLTADLRLQGYFRELYGTVDKVDLFMGGMAERHASRAVVGPTFQAIIANQFRALRDGDRFFWRNQNFDRATVDTIASTKLSHVIKRNTDTISLAETAFIAGETGIPPHAKTPAPATVIDNHGRLGRPFITP